MNNDLITYESNLQDRVNSASQSSALRQSITTQKNKTSNKIQRVQFTLYDSVNNSMVATRPISPRENEGPKGVKTAQIDITGDSINPTENFMKNELVRFKQKMQDTTGQNSLNNKSARGRNFGLRRDYYT